MPSKQVGACAQRAMWRFSLGNCFLRNAKAWGKSPIAIEQQALLALVTHILMRLFLNKKGQEMVLEEDHQTQQKRHEAKETAYCIDWEGTYNRAFFRKLSKITNQAWRFLNHRSSYSCALSYYQSHPGLDKSVDNDLIHFDNSHLWQK
jgi:hypothetical protein